MSIISPYKYKLFSLNVIAKNNKPKEQISSGDRIRSINEFSGAIVELTKNFSFYPELEIHEYNKFIEYISEKLSIDGKTLQKEILRREEIGS